MLNIFSHTFSEKNFFSVAQILHKLYVFLMYGYKNRHYLPKYHTADEVIQLLDSESDAKICVHRQQELSFGCIAYFLPFKIENLK